MAQDENKKTILVVDDDEGVRILLEAGLETEGYEVITVSNGPDAILAVEDHSPSLIIMDVMMPGLDGFETAELIRNNKKNERIPLIVLTARSSSNDKKLSARINADAYITKPFEIFGLLEKIEELIEKYQGES